MRKISLPLVKLHVLQLKKNLSIYFFFQNFEKCPEKKKVKIFRKVINRVCFDGYFYRYVLTDSLQNSFKKIFFKML